MQDLKSINTNHLLEIQLHLSNGKYNRSSYQQK
jgi:hypothetical protein